MSDKVKSKEIERSRRILMAVIDNVETVIRGKREAVELVVLALVARGHVLLEDLPGTGKTTLVSTLARSIDCAFSRIQFTPDIMPSDVSGFSIFNQKTREFEFRPGGVMSNLVLADEINRASAKTQSALLEAMEERQVTVDSHTYRLPEPFMVLATENPIEQFGTYPLPEAQLDRFLVKLSMGYPAFTQEVEVLALGDSAKRALRPVVTSEDILAVRDVASRVLAVDAVLRYIVEIVAATRSHPEIQVGSSPRGGIALLALSRAYALLAGRGYVMPDDARMLAPYVLNHRIALTHDAKAAGRTPAEVIASIVSGIAIPIADAGASASKGVDGGGVGLGAQDGGPAARPSAQSQPEAQPTRREMREQPVERVAFDQAAEPGEPIGQEELVERIRELEAQLAQRSAPSPATGQSAPRDRTVVDLSEVQSGKNIRLF